jgi:hypothetical protein
VLQTKQGQRLRDGWCYNAVLADVVSLIEAARSTSARSVNAVMTATYWAIGRSIVQAGNLAPTGYSYDSRGRLSTVTVGGPAPMRESRLSVTIVWTG